MKMSKLGNSIWDTKIRKFIHIRLAIVLTILESLTFARFHSGDFRTNHFLVDFLYGLLAGSTVIFFSLAIQKLIQSHKPEGITVRSLLKVALLLGAFKGLLFILLTTNHMTEIHGDVFLWDEALVRVITNSQMTGFVLLFMASFTIFRIKYTSTQTLLLDENEHIKEEIEEIIREIELLKRISEVRILRKVSQNLSFRELLEQTNLNSKEQWEQIANSLRIGVIKKLREESHRLGANKQARLDKARVLKDSTQFIDFYVSPTFFVYFYSVYSLSVNYDDNRQNVVFFSLLSNAILMYVGTFITQKFFSSHKGLDKFKQYFIIVSLGIYCQLAVVFSQTIFWGQSDLVFVLSALPWTLALFFGINFIYSVFSQKSMAEMMLKISKEHLTNERRILDEHRVYVENEIAKHLHGHLMLKSKTVLQKLDALEDDSVNFEKSHAILEELIEGFSLQSLRSSIELTETNTEQFKVMKEKWSSFTDVSFEGDLSAFDQMPPTQRMVASDAIEEMISNAYRHGQAQHVTITFQKSSNNQLTLTAVDDGGGISKGHKKGFGSKIFSQASNGLFSMENMSPRGAKVTLKVSINEQVEID